MIQDSLGIVAVLLAAIWFSISMVNAFPWAKRASAIIWVIFTSALLSNLGLIPTDAPIYGSLVGFAVPFAVCVILFTVNLKDVRNAGGPMLAAFALAGLGTVVGVVVASVVLEPLLSGILGPDSWKLAGPYTGTYIGGSLNFFALWTGLEIENPDLFAAANAVDNLTLFPLYMLWMTVPVFLAGRYAVAKRWIAPGSDGNHKDAEAPPLVPQDIAALFFLAVTVIAASGWINANLIAPLIPGIPTILVVTTLALILGQFNFVRQLKGAWEVGDMAFLVFFAAVGALIDFYLAVVLSPALFAYVLVIMAVHFVVVFGLGWVFKMDLGVLTIASVASKAGPALVPPVAEALGIRHLVLPGIIVGMLGYAIGNYVGFGVARAVQALLGG
ncbi:MAG: putative membrane protein [Rhodothermales bacterium]|jgi:uncharacterized membrane protein